VVLVWVVRQALLPRPGGGGQGIRRPLGRGAGWGSRGACAADSGGGTRVRVGSAAIGNCRGACSRGGQAKGFSTGGVASGLLW